MPSALTQKSSTRPAQKLEKHITEIASGASDKQLSDDWMTAINDVRMPFHLK